MKIWEDETLLFPLQWIRVCVSQNSTEGKMTAVVNGKLLGEHEYKREDDKWRPDNFKLLLGHHPLGYEYPIKITDLNVFNSSLSSERMVGLTRAGEEEYI